MKRTRQWSVKLYPLLTLIADAKGLVVGRMCNVTKPNAEYASAKRVVWQVLRIWGFSFPEIGKLCGNHDHATVIHGIQSVTGEELLLASQLAGKLTIEGAKADPETQRRKELHAERLRQWKEICERI